MKNILITGGAGFIGSNLALRLLSKGYSVRILDNLSPQIHGTNPEKTSPLFISIKDKLEFIKGSVTVKADWEKAIAGQDVIVHFAAETGTGQSMYEIERYTEVNIQGTAIMLDMLVNTPNNVNKVVIASSRSIYGEGKYLSDALGPVYPDHRNGAEMKAGNFEVNYPGAGSLSLTATDENSKIHPSSVYGITKQVQEQLVMNVCSSIGIAGVAFRYQNVYGPGQSLTNPYTGILSIFSNRIRAGLDINIFEDGLESRDFVYIDDVVNATIAGIEKEEANNKIFNVGTSIPITVLEVAKTLMKHFETEVPYKVSGMFRLGDIRHNYADISLLQNTLQVTPQVQFSEGIGKFVQWVKQQAHSESNYERSLSEMRDKGLLK
ncbi:NAD-dependent epimerase/dehydratase family protein [Mucilaginibacter mali]|uniref:NAD-dependent epimerase/dehydratase family protein n=1 Tax=Mucilaginibacter mali TaxID=2740462 RepID=A0A7D4PVC4_9SPHI|nr:NAD-dependent epimerase/dehydratase family protein [Mucilaginibacter mali]QKJ31468.1 NAD-dependent epimerase/dehydratase family protein [Mucilaginibacter mali]